MMRSDLRLVRAINDENVGPDDDREKAIRERCEKAGYQPDKDYSDEVPAWSERFSVWGW